MSEEILTEEQVKEFGTLDADTFNLAEFLDQKWEFPVFHATVYLDGARAGEISEIDQRIHELQGVIEKATRKNSKAQSGSLGGLAGASYTDTSAEEREVAELTVDRAELAEKFKTSSLKFTFQLSKPATELHKDADKATREQFPDVKDLDADDEAVVCRGKHLMLGCIKEVRNHKGQKYGGTVDYAMLSRLYETLVPSERSKLEQNMVLAISGGDVMRRAADAGFPR